jgi:hypothetical protein
VLQSSYRQGADGRTDTGDGKMDTTSIQREQIVQLYHDIKVAVFEWGMDRQADISIDRWEDLHWYCDANEFIAYLIGEDALMDAILRDDTTEIDTLISGVDALLRYDPIRFVINPDKN